MLEPHLVALGKGHGCIANTGCPWTSILGEQEVLIPRIESAGLIRLDREILLLVRHRRGSRGRALPHNLTSETELVNPGGADISR